MHTSITDSLFDACVAHHRANRLHDAQAVCQQILAIDGDHADALHLLGLLTRQLGQGDDEAIALVKRAIAINPRSPEYHCNLGLIYSELNRWAEAILAFQGAIQLRPGYPTACNYLGNALRQAGRLQESAAAYRSAVAAKPDFAVAWSNLGNVLREMNRLEESAHACRTSIAINPNFPAAHNNLANALNKLGRREEAIVAYRRALVLDPDYSQAHYNLALTLLVMGQFREGWREHEWRVKLPDQLVAPFPLDAPQWDGSDLNGRAIVIHGEQGFGDTIQFLRYVPEVIRRGGRVTLVVRPELWRLLQRDNSQGALVLKRGEIGSPACDVQLHLMSLPWVLGISEPLAMSKPYLRASAGDASRVSQEIERAEGLKVGLVWSGSPRHTGDRQRSMSLAALAPLGFAAGFNGSPHAASPLARRMEVVHRAGVIPPVAPLGGINPALHSPGAYAEGSGSSSEPARSFGVPRDVAKSSAADSLTGVPRVEHSAGEGTGGTRNVTFCSLQCGPTAAQAKNPPLPLIDLSPQLSDFTVTAEAIAALDLVIAVDTAVAHLAAAMGKPVWMVLPFAPDWRWMLDRADTPWYPTMRLFRQRAAGDWTQPVAEIAAAMAALRAATIPPP